MRDPRSGGIGGGQAAIRAACLAGWRCGDLIAQRRSESGRGFCRLYHPRRRFPGVEGEWAGTALRLQANQTSAALPAGTAKPSLGRRLSFLPLHLPSPSTDAPPKVMPLMAVSDGAERRITCACFDATPL